MLFAQSFKMRIIKINQMHFKIPFEHLDQYQLDLVVGLGSQQPLMKGVTEIPLAYCHQDLGR